MAHGVSYTRPALNPYPTLPVAEEPPVAATAAQAIREDDPHTLGRVLQEEELLQALGKALTPLVDISEVKFTGAVDKDGKVFSAYVAKGRDAQGNKLIVGFVLRVQNDEVVGVN